MLSLAAAGDSGGGYYTYAPWQRVRSPEAQPRARRSRPLWSDAVDFEGLGEGRAAGVRAREREREGRTMVVEELEVGVDDYGDGDGGGEEEDGGELRRMPRVRRCDDGEAWPVGIEEGECEQCARIRSRQAVEAENGSAVEEQRRHHHQQQKDGKKRKLSVMFSEALTDISKVIKKRTDSLVWRKDSGAELPAEILPQVRSGSHGSGEGTNRLTGSAQRSGSEEPCTDSGDAVPSNTQLRQASRQFDAVRSPRVGESATSRPTRGSLGSLYEQARRRVAQISPFETAVVEQLVRIYPDHQQDPLSAPPSYVIAHVERGLHEGLHGCCPRQRMVMIERQLRIAEREGAFDDAKRNKRFAKTYLRSCTERQQSQASAKLKEEIAKAQKKSDGQFWHSEEETSRSPKEVWGRFRRWSRGDVDIARRSDGRSASVAAAEDPGYASDDESPSPRTQRRSERRRQDAATAARYAGTALRSAPFIF